jgi:hypothetical protein
MRRALFSSILLLVYAPAFAEVNVAWARAAFAQNPGGQNTSAVVGAPDGQTTGISDNAFLYVVNFNFFKATRTPAVTYSGLGRLLGMSDAEINRYDVIAFEGNQNHTRGDGWESSIWFVTDQVRAAAGSFSADALTAQDQCCLNPSQTSPLKFRSGTITKEQFASYFQLTLSPTDAQFASWILIDVPDEIRVDANEFRLWVGGALIGTDTNPDPDAFGVIRR